jgi:hypothetical protein
MSTTKALVVVVLFASVGFLVQADHRRLDSSSGGATSRPITAATPGPASPGTGIEVELIDGSRFYGVTTLETIVVRTPQARLELPLTRIASLTVVEGGTQVAVELVNGYTICGSAEAETVGVMTLGGPLQVPLAKLAWLGVRAGDSESPAEGGTPRLVAYFAFDQDEQPARDRTGRVGSTRIDGAKWEREGFIGGALRFDGVDDCVEAAVTDALIGASGITVSAWVRPFEANHDGYVLGRWGSQFVLYADFLDGHLGWRFLARRNNRQAVGSPVGEVPVAVGEWANLVGTYAADGRLRLWLNGGLVYSEEASPAAMIMSTQPLRIGSDESRRLTFRGLIDEVAIFDGALTGPGVRALHDQQRGLRGGGVDLPWSDRLP